MSVIRRNSVDYWDNRVKTDWDRFHGSEQTAFFAKIACQLMPTWLAREIREGKYTYCDVGCATGVGVDVMSKFLAVQGSGVDFSEEAISQAKEKYPQYQFYQQDITQIKGNQMFDVLFCSNVLEHFYEPWKVIEELLKMTNHYVVLLVPFHEELEIQEHVYKFEEDKIPIAVGNFHLIYVDSMDGSDAKDSFYPGQQILMIYAHENKGRKPILLGDITRGVVKSEKLDFFRNQEKFCKQIRELQMQIREVKEEIKEKEMIIDYAAYQGREMTGSRIFRMVHFFNRLVYQGIKGNQEQRKDFRKWLFSRRRTGGDTNRTYHPLFSIIDILTEKNKEYMGSQGCFLREEQKEMLGKAYENFDVMILSVIDFDFRFQRPQHLATKFAQNGHRVFYLNANFHSGRHTKEIIGNLYVTNLYHPTIAAIYETDWKGNMAMIKDQLDKLIFDFCIRDGMVVVDYPNWVYIGDYLRRQYGFKVIADFMDDFTGFINPTQDIIRKNSIKMLQISDRVIVTSEFLYQVAKQYNHKVDIVRNGGDFSHFHKAVGERKEHNEKKVIGYYGAIAHWFDVEKVCYIARKLEGCDIVLIGEVLAGKESLKKYSNIKLLGEKPYSELPQYLKDFDVCIIPFCTDTDLIKATNPVKFYEYLSAGKKIVATEIPELEPYKDVFAYLTNDNRQFLEYTKLCLWGQDTLKNAEDCVEFAKRQDWKNRYETFLGLCKSAVPKVSIVVLTYNNLAYNQWCIESILHGTAYANYELIIVDNASTDGTREYLERLKEEVPFVKVIFNEENFGFAGGNNIGIKETTGDYIVTLNNDTLITRGWLTSLTKHMEKETDIGICGPVTNSIGNEAKIAVSYCDVATLSQFSYSYTWEHWNEQYPEPNVLALFCTMIRREVIERCGLLDERYEVGMFEDDDYAQTVRQAGYKLLIVEDAFVHHFDGCTFKKLDNNHYKEIFETNKKKFEEKWKVKWRIQKYRKGVNWDTNGYVKLDMSICEKSN